MSSKPKTNMEHVSEAVCQEKKLFQNQKKNTKKERKIKKVRNYGS
jgi:hypothetical protein